MFTDAQEQRSQLWQMQSHRSLFSAQRMKKISVQNFINRKMLRGDIPVGKFGNVAKRRVNTIFDHDISPESNMVLGEVLNDRGNWSGYLPHRHPQPETYFFKFDHPEGFGASFVGDQVFKSTDESFSAIPEESFIRRQLHLDIRCTHAG